MYASERERERETERELTARETGEKGLDRLRDLMDAATCFFFCLMASSSCRTAPCSVSLLAGFFRHACLLPCPVARKSSKSRKMLVVAVVS